MNSVPTVTLNSALSKNWVRCTVCTPRTQVACTLRVQCPCRGRCCAHNKLVARMSRAQPAQIASMLGVHLSRHAQAACSQVATSLRCRDMKATKIMSRHQIDVTTPLRTLQVATLKRGRDTKPPVANPPRSRRQFHVATSHTVAYVATSIYVTTPFFPNQSKPGRDFNFMSRPPED